MNEEQLRAALQAEYLHLQKVIEDFDGRALTIKAWSVSFSLVALGGAFASKAATIFLLSAASSLLFWFVEASWKTFQYAYYARSRMIEAHFRGETTLDSAFQIGSSWSREWRAGGMSRLAGVMVWPHVALPHAIVTAIGLILFCLAATGVIEV